METPICVADAQTFVDNIHQIKKWVYDGQLRLIIPSGFSENVELLYKKSVASKPLPKEVSKPKVFGKPTKKEYPTFDANPKVAREYLARLEEGKDHVTGVEGRPIYEELERQDGVHIARETEQYSYWKELGDYEEKQEAPVGPESWADKLRRKQIVANEQAESKIKGPVKPKLVAKTGADNSPWKVQKNSPTISGTEVPVALRPLMSFSLWRIHESIHRNDGNQIFVLTGGASVRKVAEKLNIEVRSPDELKRTAAMSQTEGVVETSGQLEELFGPRPVKERRVIKCTAMRGTPAGLMPLTGPNRAEEEAVPKEQNKTPNPNITTKPRPQWIRQSSSTNGKPVHEYKEPSLKKAQSFGALRNQESRQGPGTKPSAVDGLMDRIRQISGSGNGNATLSKEKMREGSRSTINGVNRIAAPTSVQKATVPTESYSVKPEISQEASEDRSGDVAPPSKPWSGSWAGLLSGDQGRKTSPLPEQRIAGTSVVNDAFPLPGVKADAPLSSPSGRSATETPPPQDKAKEESIITAAPALDMAPSSIDSDEEIIVFKPKQNRLSAQQKKPEKQSSRPTTPNTQAQVATTMGLQDAQTQVNPRLGENSKNQTTPKAAPRQRHASKHMREANGGRHATHPQAPVIDPDAFGRDFAVNTHSNKGSIRGPRMRHSPQPSLFDAGVSTSRPTSSHRPNRRSPSRVSPKMSPPQKSNLPMDLVSSEPAIEAFRHQPPTTSTPRAQRTSQPRPLPIGNGRLSISPAPEIPPQSVVSLSPLPAFAQSPSIPTLNANAPVFQPGGLSNPLLQSPFQPDFGTPKSNPPIQPPIGSGRPSSKTSQPKSTEPDDRALSPVNGLAEITQELLPTPEPVQVEQTSLRELTMTPPKGPRNGNANVSRQLTFPQPNGLQVPISGPKFDQTPVVAPNGNRFNRMQQSRNGDFHRGRGGRGGFSNVRQPKPSLFEPDLDHTRAYQPDTVEPKKNAQPDVQFVLKSGSTREEARGKGRLWVG